MTADAKPVLSVEGAISLSENPVLRFRYRASEPKTLTAHVEDTEGNIFEQSWNASGEPKPRNASDPKSVRTFRDKI